MLILLLALSYPVEQYEYVDRVVFLSHTVHKPDKRLGAQHTIRTKSMAIERRDWFNNKSIERLCVDDDFPFVLTEGPYKKLTYIRSTSSTLHKNKIVVKRFKTRSVMYHETVSRFPGM